MHIQKSQFPSGLDESLGDALGCERSRGRLGDASIDRVLRLIESDQIPDYQSDGAAFAYLYYPVNFIKAATAIDELLPVNDSTVPFIEVLDLGCGSGASTAAIASVLGPRAAHVRIVAFDRCARQLELLSEISLPWIRQQHPNVEVVVTNGDVRDITLLRSPRVVVCSYLLTELTTPERLSLIQRLKKQLQGGLSVIILDSDSAGRPFHGDLRSQDRPFVYPEDPLKFNYHKRINADAMPKMGPRHRSGHPRT